MKRPSRQVRPSVRLWHDKGSDLGLDLILQNVSCYSPGAAGAFARVLEHDLSILFEINKILRGVSR